MTDQIKVSEKSNIETNQGQNKLEISAVNNINKSVNNSVITPDINKVVTTTNASNTTNADTAFSSPPKGIFLFKRKFTEKYNKVENYIKTHRLLREMIATFIALLSFILYGCSLSGCYDTEEECLRRRPPQFYEMLLRVALAASFFCGLAIFLCFSKFCTRFHLIYIFGVYIVFFILYHGGDLGDHGKYNMILIIVAAPAFFAIICFFSCLILMWKKKKYILVIGIISSIIIVFIIFKISIKLASNCKDWDKGLNQTYIYEDSEKYGCAIWQPDTCHISTFQGYFDLTRILGVRCDKRTKNEMTILKKTTTNKYVTMDTKRLGFPITCREEIKDFNLKTQLSYVGFLHHVMDRMVDMDNEEQMESLDEYNKPEVYVDFTKDPYGEIKINVEYHKELSEQRKKLEIPDEGLYKNILVFFMDAVSRPQFLRRMPKTCSFIEKFMPYNNNLGYHSFQFLKYHTFASSTIPNMHPMFYGTNHNDKNGTQVIKYLKEHGFVTGQTIDMCSKELARIEHRGSRYVEGSDKVNYIEFDHENIAMFCDPQFSKLWSYHLLSGAYSLTRRCLYGKDTFDHQFEYLKQFWKKYKDNKKFFRMAINLGHEGTGEVLSYIDEETYNVFNTMYENGDLKDTALFILSDHGNQMPFIYNIIGSGDYDRERRLGTLFLVLPDKNNTVDEFYEGINENQQSFVTPYDIHDTFVHICYGISKEEVKKNINKKEYKDIPYTLDEGNSLFTAVSFKRTCKLYTNWFPGDDLCACF